MSYILGTRAPKFTMGFSNDFRYKGFDLNIYLYASVGGYSYPYTQVEHGVYGGNGIQRLKDNNNFGGYKKSLDFRQHEFCYA